MATIMPAFSRYPQEAQIIGVLLAGYGEIEFGLADCFRAGFDDHETYWRATFRLRQESERLNLMHAFLLPAFKLHGLDGDYGKAFGWVKDCKSIRNTYAHCHWGDNSKIGLYYVNLQDTAAKASGFPLNGKPLKLQKLKQEEAFFVSTRAWLNYLSHELALRSGKAQSNPFSTKPPEITKP